MSETNHGVLVQQLKSVLREALFGPVDPTWSHFVNNKPDSGLLGALRSVSAAKASTIVGTASIAGHIHHTIFGMEVAVSWVSGERASHDWSESWSVNSVDEETWRTMIGRIEELYEGLCEEIDRHVFDDEIAAGAAVGAVAHIAYHLGAVQQKMEILLQQP